MKAVVAGYGLHCNEDLLAVAKKFGFICKTLHLELFAGGYQGVFEAAMIANNQNTLVLEKERVDDVPNQFPARIISVASTPEKHIELAQRADCAFVLGGGQGSTKVVEAFIQSNKPVFVFKNTGGAADQLSGETIFEIQEATLDSIQRALSILKQR